MSESSTKDNCIFCTIASNKDPKTTLVFDNDRIVVFKDIRPAAKYHFLAIPKYHINDAKCLTVADTDLVIDMRNALEQALIKDNDIDLNDASFGFHWPPFNSVKHLHMHGIAPASSMSFISRCVFKPMNMWYRTTEYVLAELAAKKQPDQEKQ